MKATQLLHDLGQSLWLDNITRDLLNSGTLTHEAETIDRPIDGAAGQFKSSPEHTLIYIIYMGGYRPQGNRLRRRDMSVGTRADRGTTDFSDDLSVGRGQQTKAKRKIQKTYYVKQS